MFGKPWWQGMEAKITAARSWAKTREWRGAEVDGQEHDRERGMVEEGNDGRERKGWAEETHDGL